MAHNLNKSKKTGKYAFMSVNEKAWHGLGTVVTEYPNSQDALKHAGLDFEVLKAPNIHRVPAIVDANGKEVIAGRDEVSTRSFFTYRDDTAQVLGARVGSDYTPVQNRNAFEFFDAIVGGGDGIQYETAGALGDGERIFITAKLPSYIKVGAGDKDMIEKYLFLTNSHDGTSSIIAAFTPIRIVCNNTLTMALGNMQNTVRITHTKTADARLKLAHKVMGIADKLSTELGGIFNHWAKVRITDAEVKKLIQMAMAPNKETIAKLVKGVEADELSAVFNNQVDAVLEYMGTNDTQLMATTKGTLYGAYNGVTGFFQNAQNWDDNESKIKSIMWGSAKGKSESAFSLCMDYSKTGKLN